MEIEIHGIPRSMKPQFQARLKTVKAELMRFKKLSKDAHSQLSRSDLLSAAGGVDLSSTSDNPYGPGSDRTRLLAGVETLSDGSRRLIDSQRIALDTETHGAEILRTLRGQREQIENARNTVRRLRLFTSHSPMLNALANSW
jgi:vesicle transport through interaction with t-SNAREs protein 1